MSVTWKAAPAQPRTYTLRELADELGVPYRTVKWYREKRLISAPSPPMGPLARYTDNHLSEAKQVIKRCHEDRVFVADLIADASCA